MSTSTYKYFGYRRLIGSVFFILVVFSTSAVAQQTTPLVNSTLDGTVVDARTKDPLVGATLQLSGVTHSTQTDNRGRFRFVTGQKFPYTIVVSFVGYQTKEVVANGSPLNIELEQDATGLDEVVVVGYTTQERRNVIGSITKVDPSETAGIPVGGVDAQLQGKIPGVQISSNTGIPGESVNIRLRGATSISSGNGPLFIVDGVFVNSNSLQTVNTGGKSTSPIADINPADIASIEVLKDAEATALYGSRGANGVIIITTKKGDFNQRPQIDLNVSQGWAKAAKLWELTTGPEHALLVNEYFTNIGRPAPFRPVDEIIDGVAGRGLPEEQQTYDRLGEAFHTGGLGDYNLSIRGGSANTRYYISGGYNKQEAILRPINFDRASFKLNLDQKLSDFVQIGTSNTFGRSYRNQGRAGDGPAGGILQAALHTPTYLSPYNENGELVGRAGFDNLTLLLNNYDVNSASLRYIGNIFAEAKLLKHLTLKSSFSLDYNSYDESEYWKSFLIAGAGVGTASSAITQSSSWINEQLLSYRTAFGTRHNLGILIGNTLQSNVVKRTSASGQGFANDSFTLISSAASTTGSDDWDKYTLASFFARIDYGFDNKYLIDFSIRADGSSKFGSANPWGYFPAVGVGWRLKQESFLQDVAFIDDFKIRASYGSTGNQNGIGNFAARGLWTGGASYQEDSGIAPEQLGNPNLRWERTDQFNIGVDLTLLKGRLAFDFNVYDKYTRDGLLPLSLGATSGFNSFTSNAVEVSNKGFELAVNSININKRGFTWSTSFNIARNVNKIEKLATTLNYGSRDLIRFEEGYPMYSFWVYKQLYVDPETGDAVYEDVDGNGQRTTADRQIYGSIWPDFFGGISNDFSYKRFDLSAFFNFSYGNEIYNHNRFFGESGGARDAARILFKNNLNRWQQRGDITDVPKADGLNVNNYIDGGSRWLEDGSYLRLRNVTLGYTLPDNVAERVKLSRFRIYVAANNLFTWTSYTGLDPEASANSSENQVGIDLGTPPQPRSFQLGLQLTL